MHTQDASYLDVIHDEADGWNPSDYAYHLTRRARGLPLWFSLAVNGSDAYRDAIERVLATTRAAAERIRALPHLELVREPELSVVLFRRTGWSAADYDAWSARLLEDADRVRRSVPMARRARRPTRVPAPGDDARDRRRDPRDRPGLGRRGDGARQHAPQRPRRAARAASSSRNIARACEPLGGITRKRA